MGAVGKYLPNPRLIELDVLRTAAVLLVLIRHIQILYPGDHTLVGRILEAFQRAGWIGVDLFFVLSGFLVSGLLFKEFQRFGEIKIISFLIRRALKIYPAFYFFLFVTVTLRSLKHPLELNRFFSELFFVQNYFPAIWNHTWSLAVEEHFYLALSGLFFLILKIKTKKQDPFRGLPPLFFLLAALLLSFRLMRSTQPFSHMTHTFPTHLRLDSLFFGTFLSYLFHFRKNVLDQINKKLGRWLGWIGAACFVPAFYFTIEETPWLHTYGFSVIYFGAGCILLHAILNGLNTNTASRLLGYVGSDSYSIYIWHIRILNVLMVPLMRKNLPGLAWQAGALIYIVLCFCIGILIAKMIEIPALKLRDRLIPSRVGAALTSD